MPNRMLRDWTGSEKVNGLSVHAERFFTRLIMKVDDYGCLFAHVSLLKANLFPLLLDAIREADISRWMAECQKAGLIVLYEANGKKYLQILDFRQRLDKAKAKYPLPTNAGISLQFGNDVPETVNDFPAEVELEVELEQKNRANALGGQVGVKKATKENYEQAIAEYKNSDRKIIWSCVKEFILTLKPDFIEPYVDAWNLFATNYRLATIEVISDSRRKKFKTRIAESGFDFLRVLEKIKTSGHLKGDNGGNWKVTFDWILENDKNYLKIIEGNYD